MCPPYFRAHTHVRPYENIENYTWDTTLVWRFIIAMIFKTMVSPPLSKGGEGDFIITT